MVTHLRIRLVLMCLTSVICPFTLTAFTFGSCFLYCLHVSHNKDGWAVNFFHKGIIGSPTWMGLGRLMKFILWKYFSSLLLCSCSFHFHPFYGFQFFIVHYTLKQFPLTSNSVKFKLIIIWTILCHVFLVINCLFPKVNW